MKELLKINEEGEVVEVMSCVNKTPTCVRLSDNGKIKLQELCNYFGISSKSTMIELLITLQHEKILVLKKGEPPNEKTVDEYRERCANFQKDERED